MWGWMGGCGGGGACVCVGGWGLVGVWGVGGGLCVCVWLGCVCGLCVCMFVFDHVCVPLCVYVRVCGLVHVCVGCMYVCIFISVCVCVLAHVFVCGGEGEKEREFLYTYMAGIVCFVHCM